MIGPCSRCPVKSPRGSGAMRGLRLIRHAHVPKPPGRAPPPFSAVRRHLKHASGPDDSCCVVKGLTMSSGGLLARPGVARERQGREAPRGAGRKPMAGCRCGRGDTEVFASAASATGKHESTSPGGGGTVNPSTNPLRRSAGGEPSGTHGRGSLEARRL